MYAQSASVLPKKKRDYRYLFGINHFAYQAAMTRGHPSPSPLSQVPEKEEMYNNIVVDFGKAG